LRDANPLTRPRRRRRRDATRPRMSTANRNRDQTPPREPRIGESRRPHLMSTSRRYLSAVGGGARLRTSRVSSPTPSAPRRSLGTEGEDTDCLTSPHSPSDCCSSRSHDKTMIITVNALLSVLVLAAAGSLVRLVHRLPETAPHHDEQWGTGGDPWVPSDPLPLHQVARHEAERALALADRAATSTAFPQARYAALALASGHRPRVVFRRGSS
jgi:hypothetical protein